MAFRAHRYKRNVTPIPVDQHVDGDADCEHDQASTGVGYDLTRKGGSASFPVGGSSFITVPGAPVCWRLITPPR